MASYRKDLKLGMAQRDLVNFSVKAQDQILRAAADGIIGGSATLNGSILGSGTGGYKTTDDLMTLGGAGATTQYPGVSKVLNSISIGGAGTNITTNGSQHDVDPSKLVGINRSVVEGGGDNLLLPSIKSVRKQQASPFKNGAGTNAFFDMPVMLATQKMMRQTVRAAAAERTNQPGSSQPYNPANAKSFNSPHETARGGEIRSTRSADRNNNVKMNPKVLETWINETLQDAEHLDIPGVILKPEHKNPISRYGIDRLALTNAGIPNELVDRIFRALFVYSVGFYELVKKCLQHTERKYSIITAIWKVFSILLEYCCKTDYRMLISEISKEHKDELDRLEREFQQKFGEQAENERILKKNMEILQRYTEEIEKDRNSERQMRLKLEEEYMQNTKNHEEEVQLRLKFESKLNNMHSVHRDLETKYKRALSELAGLQTINEQLYQKTVTQAEEITSLKTVKAEMEAKISYNDEKIAGLQREVGIKIRQVQDLESKFAGAQDELDLTKYKLQELQKDLTEQKLKIDVFESQVIGLKNEKQHLLLELKETKDLQKVYEKKCGTLISEVNKVNLEFQESKREIIGFGEIQKEREERIDKLKTELRELKAVHEDLDLKHGTLCIQHDKVKEQYETSKRDLDDAIEKLHVTNKVRHETELKLSEEIERGRALQDVIRDKDEQLHKRAQEIEDMDRRVIELERTNENIEIKKASLERQFEITKKQLNEKISSLNEILQSEKETREMWIERYEKEQKEHTQTNANLLHAKSQLKDQTLATKNVEIKLQTTQKANEVLTEQNARLQDQLNEALAKQENLERDVNTQKEIMKQMEANRKEYIQKLKQELLTVESRFHQKVDQAEMVAQDFLSRAAENVVEWQLMKGRFEGKVEELKVMTEDRDGKAKEIEGLQMVKSNMEMRVEELHSLIGVHLNEKVKAKDREIEELKAKKSELEDLVEEQKLEVEQKKKIEQLLHDFKEEMKLTKGEMLTLKKTNDKLQHQIASQQEQMAEHKAEIERLQQEKATVFTPDQQQQLTSSQQQHRSTDQKSSQKSIGEKSLGIGSKPGSVDKSNIRPQYPKVKSVEVQTDMIMSQYTTQQMQQYQMNQGPQPTMMMRTQQQVMPVQLQSANGPLQIQTQNQQMMPDQYNKQFVTPMNNNTMMSPFNQTQTQIGTNDQHNLDSTIMMQGNDPLIGTAGPLGSILQSPMAAHQFTIPDQYQGELMQQHVPVMYDQNGQPFYPQSATPDGNNPLRSQAYSGTPQQMMYAQMQNGMTPQQQQYSSMMQQIIPEMHADQEEDRRSPMQQTAFINGQPVMQQQMAIDQRSSQQSGIMQNPMLQDNSTLRHPSQQQSQILAHQNSLSQASNGGGSVHAGNSIHGGMQRAPSKGMTVEYKNMSTVMQHQSSQGSQQSSVNRQQMSQFTPQQHQQINAEIRGMTGQSVKSGQLNGQMPPGSAQSGVPNQYQQQSSQGPISLLNQQQYPGQQQFPNQQNPNLQQYQQYQPQQMSIDPMNGQQIPSNMPMQQNQPSSQINYPGQQQSPLSMQQPALSQQQMMMQSPNNSNVGEDYRGLSAGDVQQIQTSQASQPMANTRLKVDITNSSYGAQNSDQQRRQLNSGGAMSVHTPMSQVSGYSNHLAPQNGRFQQQPPTIITSGQPNVTMNSNAIAMQGSSAGMASMNSGAGGAHPVSSGQNDRKVMGKSSIRTLIKAAATRD